MTVVLDPKMNNLHRDLYILPRLTLHKIQMVEAEQANV